MAKKNLAGETVLSINLLGINFTYTPIHTVLLYMQYVPIKENLAIETVLLLNLLGINFIEQNSICEQMFHLSILILHLHNFTFVDALLAMLHVNNSHNTVK